MIKQIMVGILLSLQCTTLFTQTKPNTIQYPPDYRERDSLMKIDYRLYQKQEKFARTKSSELSKSQNDSVLVRVGDWLWGNCFTVDTYQDSFAVIGNGMYVHVMNIAQPDSPKIVGEYLTYSIVHDLAIRDSLAYVLVGKNLLILDLEDPYSPSKVSEIILTGTFVDNIVLDSIYAYITYWGGVGVVDISDPANPIKMDGIGLVEEISNPVARNGYIYITGTFKRREIFIIDARDPAWLRGVKTFYPPYKDGTPWTLYLKDTLLFVGENDSNAYLDIYSIADPENPVHLSRNTVGDGWACWPHSLLCSDSILYYGTVDSGIYAINVLDVYNTKILGNVRRPFSKIGNDKISIAKNTLAVATSTGVWFIDAEQPEAMKTESYFLTGDYKSDIALKDNYAIITEWKAGITILDVSNPYKPERVSAIEIPRRLSEWDDGVAKRLAINGDYLYVTNSYSLEVIDINDIINPRIIGFEPLKSPWPIVINNNFAYVTLPDSGFTIFDLKEPVNPKRLGTYLSNAQSGFLSVSNSIVALSIYNKGLKIVNVSDPYHPLELTTIPGFASGIILKDSLAYISLDGCLSIFSLMNPNQPKLHGSVDIPGSRSYVDMDISNNFCYLGLSSLFTVDISFSNTPIIVGIITSIGYTAGIKSSGNYLFYCDDIGIRIVKNNLITSVSERETDLGNDISLLQNFPNPFNSITKIRYSLTEKHLVTIKVYDLLGREITTLINEEKLPGEYIDIFDRESLPSGVFYYRLTTNNYSQTKRMVIIK